MSEWVSLGTVAVDAGMIAITGVPVPEGITDAAERRDVALGFDLRPTDSLNAVLARTAFGDGRYPVMGLLEHDEDGQGYLAEVKVVFTA
ncbi:hypothetical protein [Cellulomonas sp. NPDC058312]|uniref:hypothetical protein n=1 Tax=Cellulomonas sp. NPDC058312 TaxID=3346441 RepID=UPI0036E52E29